jgi:hypothetical protein
MMMNIRLLMAVLLLFGVSAVGAQSGPTPEKMINEGNYRGAPWISGGVGEGERKYLLEEYTDDFNLKLEFAVAQGSYLADVWVRITKPTGEVVVNSLSDGPWFMTKLPAGTYKVQAMGFGKTFEKTVEVPATGLQTVVFNQWTKAEVAKQTPGPTY